MTEAKKPLIVSEQLAEEMFRAGVQFGHKKSNRNPKMEPYIFGIRNNIQIIDLEKTMESLQQAIDFIKDLLAKDGKILFVGTRPQNQALIEDIAKHLKMPYVSMRWTGGLLTNFKTLRKRIDHFLDLEKKREDGELKKYTKKEQKDIDTEIEKFKKNFGGLREMTKLPDAMFVLGIKEHLTPIKEAKKKKIPIISLVDTDSDPTMIDYAIPANDDAVSSLKLILDKIKESVL